jgi:solute carrier family 25 phosphate transporter 23/24/25/41
MVYDICNVPVKIPFTDYNRLQAQGSSMQTQQYPRGAIDVVLKTYHQDGLRGFYRGLVPNLIKVVPAVSLTYITYEHAKRQMHIT